MITSVLIGAPAVSVGRDAFEWARDTGAEGVELWALDNDFDPRHLTLSGRQDLAHSLARYGLACTALRADTGGFHNPAYVDEHVARTLDVLNIALAIPAPMITLSPGTIPDNPENRAYRGMAEALNVLAAAAAERGLRVAMDSGGNDPEAFETLQTKLSGPGIVCAFDPADHFSRGEDVLEVLHRIRGTVGHAYLRDMRRDEGEDDWIYSEVTIGTGQVPLVDCLALLDETGFAGSVSVARTRCPQRVQDLEAGIRFLNDIRTRISRSIERESIR